MKEECSKLLKKHPNEGLELIRIVSLRNLGKELGFEKINLKQNKLYLYFMSNDSSDYYQSPQFGKILNYMQQNPRKCQLRENRGKRSMMIENIYKVEEAVNILTEMKNSNI